MFAKLKGGTGGTSGQAGQTPIPATSPETALHNPISQYFEIGKQIGSAGPELAWKVYEAYRKSDGKEVSVFYFDKKWTEKFGKSSGKRRECISEVLKCGALQLDRFRHSKILQIIAKVEETNDNLAFASEPIIGSLANILGYLEDRLRQGVPSVLREYTFSEFETKYGLLQITEALLYLHYTCKIIHRNICPQSVIINKRGTWKLSGFEFTVKCNDGDNMIPVSCPAFTSKSPKMSQPDLDFMAPEVQASSACSPQSDMFSFGLLICSIFNNGRSPIQANLSTANYTKQLETLNRSVQELLDRMPILLAENVPALLEPASRKRPTSHTFSMIKYFHDQGVHALQYLDTIQMKDSMHKANFYPSLRGVLCTIPKKMWFQHILPTISAELQFNDVLAAALQPILYIIEECNTDEYQNYILPIIRNLYQAPKSVQATVTLLENINILIRKSGQHEIKNEILPMLFNSLDSSQPQVQIAALSAISEVIEHLEENTIKQIVIPKARQILEVNDSIQVQTNILNCVAKVIDNLEKNEILDDVLPLLLEAKLSEISILTPVLAIYRHMLSDKRFGLNVNLLATKVMPTLIPIIVSPNITVEEFNTLADLLQEMLDQINRSQRNKLKLERMSTFSTEKYPLQHNLDQPTGYPHRPPCLKLSTRRQSISVDDVLKTTTINSNASSPDLNLLRVQTNLPYRRHSDNAIEPPRILIASATPGYGSGTLSKAGSMANLPRRRHSSVNPNEVKGISYNFFTPSRPVHKVGSNSSFKLDFPIPGRTSPGRGRRYSVATIINQSQSTSSTILNQLGTGVQQLFGR
ncbi:SCY1-like protein 2 [Tetranychus urticae]|nr:SCY1-like protein 2 [Tetranychus urticae]